MLPDDLDNLRDLCKNEECFKELKQIVDALNEEKEEKEKQLSLLDAATGNGYESILITDLHLEKPGPKIVYVNNGFCRMTGYSKEEVIGKTPRILQGPKTERKVLDRLKERLSSGQSFFGQAVNYRKDGSEFMNQWDIHPLLDHEGNPTHWVSYQHDISDRKHYEKRFFDTKVEFDDLYEQTHSTIIDIDREGNIISANNAFLSLTGYNKDELEHSKIWKLFPSKFREILKKRFNEIGEGNFLDDKEFKGIARHKSGILIQVKGISRLVDLNENEQVIRVEIQNISFQKKVRDNLQKHQRFLGKKLNSETRL